MDDPIKLSAKRTTTLESQPGLGVQFLVIASLGAAAVVVCVVGWLVMYFASVRLSPDPIADAKAAAEEKRVEELERLSKLGPPGPALDATMVARGQRLYSTACVACHGVDARGVATMGGKNLIDSIFVKRTQDSALVEFIAKGRAIDDPKNTSQKMMPPRGGRTDYTDAHLADVVSYIRYLRDPRRVQGALPTVKVALLDDDEIPVTSANATVPVANGSTPVVVALNSPAVDPKILAMGRKAFMVNCITCHAVTGLGVPKMGADLVHSKFVPAKSDDELLEFIKHGRTPTDPDSVLKLTMPPKGGNPALKDEQIRAIIVYIRSLEQAAAEKK